jgi:hypothetical protein
MITRTSCFYLHDTSNHLASVVDGADTVILDCKLHLKENPFYGGFGILIKRKQLRVENILKCNFEKYSIKNKKTQLSKFTKW